MPKGYNYSSPNFRAIEFKEKDLGQPVKPQIFRVPSNHRVVWSLDFNTVSQNEGSEIALILATNVPTGPEIMYVPELVWA